MTMGCLVVFLCLCFVGGLGYHAPENTCPNYLTFNYLYGLAVGILDIPNDGTGDYSLAVNGSLPFQTNQRLKITIPDYNDIIKEPTPILKYHLYFPSQQGFPRITSVIFNDRRLCFSTPYPVGVNGRTSVWAFSKLTASAQIGVFGPTITDDQIYFPGNSVSPPTPPTPPVYFTPSPAPVRPVIVKPSPTKPPPPPPPPITKPTITPTPTTQKPTVELFTSRNNDQMCGVVLTSIPLVLLGDPVMESEFPWMSALHVYSNKNKNYKFLCTASLISDKHVITAGHCVNYEGIILYDMEDLIFVFGRTRLENWARSGIIGNVAKVTIHPNYEQDRGGHDVAIFTLTKPLKFSSVVYPLCIWDSIVGGRALNGVVAGWGQSNAKKRFHDIVPYKLTMPVIDQEECENSHPVNVGLTSQFVFCAGSKDGSGPCGGDAGAAFMVDIKGRRYLMGILSHVETKNGTACDLSKAVLFTDLTNEKDWIKSVINEG